MSNLKQLHEVAVGETFTVHADNNLRFTGPFRLVAVEMVKRNNGRRPDALRCTVEQDALPHTYTFVRAPGTLVSDGLEG